MATITYNVTRNTLHIFIETGKKNKSALIIEYTYMYMLYM